MKVKIIYIQIYIRMLSMSMKKKERGNKSMHCFIFLTFCCVTAQRVSALCDGVERTGRDRDDLMNGGFAEVFPILSASMPLLSMLFWSCDSIGSDGITP